MGGGERGEKEEMREGERERERKRDLTLWL